ncbi:hypothetical protein HN446_03115 [bacterium]|jgi:hypothetical protein|nr:hypothetical protein [bacterium]
MSKTHNKTLLYVGLLSIAFLPACDFFKSDDKKASAKPDTHVSKDDKDKGQVLLTIKGEPVVREKDFQQYFETFLETNPRIKQIMHLMPDAKKGIFMSMTTEEVLLAWLKENGIDKSEGFKNELDKAMKVVERNLRVQLAAKNFEEKHPVKVDEKDVKKHYEENKHVPGIMIAPGGTKAEGVEFDNKDKAEDFLKEVKNEKDFKKFAESKKLTVKDFGMVNDMRHDVKEDLRKKILDIDRTPTKKMFEVDKKFWVVFAEKKEDAKHHPYDAVKDQIKERVRIDKTTTMFKDEVDKLKKDYDVKENEEYFDKKNEEDKKDVSKHLEDDENGAVKTEPKKA